MAEITPTPQVGTWLRITGWDEEWTPQPQVGTWLRITGWDEQWTPQPQVGTWLHITSWSGFPWTPTPRRHGRLYGLGRGTRSVH